MYPSFRLFFVLLTSILVALIAAACSYSGPTDPDYKFREGDVTKYTFQTSQKGNVTIDDSTEDFNLHMVNTISQKVQKVDEQGVATVDVSYDDTKLTVNGEDLPLPDFADTFITYEVDGDGFIRNVRGTHGLAGPLGERQFDPGQIFQFQGPMFREGVLKKGDKWQQTIAIPLTGADNVQATIDYTFVGMERVKEKEAAKLSFVFDAPLDVILSDLDQVVKVVGREQMEGTALFSIEDGRTIKASGKGPLKLTMSMPSEGGGEDIERLKVDIETNFDYQLQD